MTSDALHHANLLAASTGGRTYRHLPAETPQERTQREHQHALERLATRLQLADQHHPGSGTRAQATIVRPPTSKRPCLKCGRLTKLTPYCARCRG